MDSNIANNEEVQHHSPTNDAMQQDDVNAGEHNLQHELVENTNELKFYNELESYFLRERRMEDATDLDTATQVGWAQTGRWWKPAFKVSVALPCLGFVTYNLLSVH